MRNKNIKGHYTNANMEKPRNVFKQTDVDDDLIRWVIMFGHETVSQEIVFALLKGPYDPDVAWINRLLSSRYVEWVRAKPEVNHNTIGFTMDIRITQAGIHRMQAITEAANKDEETEMEKRRRRITSLVNNLWKGGGAHKLE